MIDRLQILIYNLANSFSTINFKENLLLVSKKE